MHWQGNLHNRVEKLRHELDEVQKALDKNPTSSVLREEEAAYLTAYTKALLDEERFLKQKVKIKWPHLGDSNLAYFHRFINARISRSWIVCVYGHDNIMYEGNIVPNVFVNHYTSFLGVEGGDMCRATKDFFTNSQMFVGPLESDIRFIKLN
ncbi:hypothetical protein Tco_0998549 [Tanacetum coccineum]